MKNSFPPLKHAAALVGYFSRIARQLTSENFHTKRKKDRNNNSRKKLKFIVVNALFPARSILCVNHTNCGVHCFPINHAIKKIELIHSPRGHYLATIPLTRSQNDPGFGALTHVALQSCLPLWLCPHTL